MYYLSSRSKYIPKHDSSIINYTFLIQPFRAVVPRPPNNFKNNSLIIMPCSACLSRPKPKTDNQTTTLDIHSSLCNIRQLVPQSITDQNQITLCRINSHIYLYSPCVSMLTSFRGKVSIGNHTGAIISILPSVSD